MVMLFTDSLYVVLNFELALTTVPSSQLRWWRFLHDVRVLCQPLPDSSFAIRQVSLIQKALVRLRAQ